MQKIMSENQKSLERKIVFEKITKLSFVMSIFVIYIHASNLNYFGWDNEKNMAWLIERLVGVGFGDCCVPTFFVISGYLFFRNIDLSESFESLKIKISNKWKKRVNSLIVPYLIWNTVGCVFYMFIARLPLISSMMRNAPMEISLANLIRGVLLHEAYFPLWYIATLIICVLLTPLIWFLEKNIYVGVACLSCVAVCGVFHIDFPELETRFLFCFMIGAFLSMHFENFVESKYSLKLKITAFLIFISFVVIRSWGDTGIWSTVILYISPILIWICFPDRQKISGEGFSSQSFFIYVSHVIIVTSVGKILLKILGHSVLAVLVAYLIAPIITLIIIYILYRILSTKMPTIYKILSGNRNR